VIRLTHLPPGWEFVEVRLNGEELTNKPVDFTGAESPSRSSMMAKTRRVPLDCSWQMGHHICARVVSVGG